MVALGEVLSLATPRGAIMGKLWVQIAGKYICCNCAPLNAE